MKWAVPSIVGIALVAAGGYYLFSAHLSPAATVAAVADATEASSTPYTVPPLTKRYINSTYTFSLMMPESFSAQDISDPSQGGATLVLQDQSGNGIQIVISPWDEDTSGSYTLTAGRIHQDLPDLAINDPQPVVVGPNYTGLAFKSDNPAFGGDSREVWFVFNHHLYQISTYARLDPLLQAIFGTWSFN